MALLPAVQFFQKPVNLHLSFGHVGLEKGIQGQKEVSFVSSFGDRCQELGLPGSFGYHRLVEGCTAATARRMGTGTLEKGIADGRVVDGLRKQLPQRITGPGARVLRPPHLVQRDTERPEVCAPAENVANIRAKEIFWMIQLLDIRCKITAGASDAVTSALAFRNETLTRDAEVCKSELALVGPAMLLLLGAGLTLLSKRMFPGLMSRWR